MRGFIAFMAERITKEIAIRKVFSATANIIFRFISREFIILILIANFIAWIATYFAFTRWFQNFAYQTKIPLIVFVIATIITFVTSFLAVIFYTLKASHTNPVDHLRYEWISIYYIRNVILYSKASAPSQVNNTHHLRYNATAAAIVRSSNLFNLRTKGPLFIRAISSSICSWSMIIGCILGSNPPGLFRLSHNLLFSSITMEQSFFISSSNLILSSGDKKYLSTM